MHQNSYCIPLRIKFWAGELVCGFRASQKRGLRKLRPQVELQRPQGRKARALAPEQKRNVHPASAYEAY